MTLLQWLKVWGVTLAVALFIALFVHSQKPLEDAFFGGLFTLVIAGCLASYRISGRGCSSVVFVVAGMIGAILAAVLAEFALPGAGSFSSVVQPLGVVLGLLLANGGVSLWVLLLNLGIYWAICLGVGLKGGASPGVIGLLASFGFSLILPPVLEGIWRRRRGDDGSAADRRGLEKVLLTGAALFMTIGVMTAGFNEYATGKERGGVTAITELVVLGVGCAVLRYIWRR